MSNSGFFSIGNVEVNTPSQELVFQTDFRINNLTITDCAYVDVTTVSLYVLGNLTLTAMSGDFGGDTFLGSGSEIIFVAQNLVNPNDLIRGNANWGFNGFSHTVQLKSATLNNCSIGVGQLAAPTLECGSFASPAIVSGVFSAYTGSTCTFQTNTALSANSISINGSSPSSRVTLTSSGIWFLNVTSPTSVSYVSAKYSDASGGSTIYATDGTSLDVGFNFNWEFPSTTTTSSSTSTSTSSSTSTSTSTSSTSTSTSSTSSSTSSTSLSSSSSSSTSSTSTATASTSTSTTLTSTSTTVTTTVSDYYYIEIHKNIKSVTSFLGGKK